MNRSSFKLWLQEAVTELRKWPRTNALVWLGCLLGSLLLWWFAIAAKQQTQQSWVSNSALTSPKSSVEASAPQNQTAELVILDDVAPQVAAPAPDDESLRRISETALALHSRLQEGPDTATQHASKSGRIAGLAVAMRQDQLANSDGAFWQPMSEVIAELELAVRLGDIADGPAIGLITELRGRYAELRAAQGSSLLAPSPSPSPAPAASPEAVPERAEPDAVILESAQSRAALPFTLRALPWLTALLPLGCLLFGFKQLTARMRRRHEADPKAGYNAIVEPKQAAKMTAAPPAPNRHAAERRTQAAILQLLDEMEPLAEGDLSQEATVNEDLTGALADAFNHAVHELRRLVSHINSSSEQVRAAVVESRTRTFKMAKQGAVQAREVNRTNDRLDQMQLDVQSLSTTSHQVAAYAQDVAERTQHAAKAVERSCDALAKMRTQANLAERSMRRLVGSTQGIEARLSEVQAAAKRTDLLALNSTIHAASRTTVAEGEFMDASDARATGSPTQNFAELATDVSSLANLLGTATRDIDQLSDVITDEAKDSLQAMLLTVAQVETTEQLTRDAQNHLNEIATAAQALGTAVVEVASRTEEQAQGVTDIAGTTRVINDITHDTATALTQAVDDLQRLENLSHSLEASVHGFRLPAENES